MPNSVRPWVTAGVAIVGAGVIVIAPVEPMPHTRVQIANAAIELTAAPNPFEYYPQVLMRSLANASDRLDEYFSDPFPIVRALAQNQYAAYADIINAAGSFDPVAVATATLRAIAQPVVNLVKVLSSGEPFETAASLLVRLLPPIVSGVLAAGSAAGDVVEAFFDLDVVGVVSAMINIPARIVDGLVNGRIDGVTDENLGLLTPVIDAPVADEITGPVAFLIDSLHNIGDTISSASPSGALAPAGHLPGLAAPAVTLPIAPEQPAAQEDPAAEVTPPDTNPDDAPEIPQAEPEPTEPEPEPADSRPGFDIADSDGSADTTRGPAAESTDEGASQGASTTDDADVGSSDGGGTDGSDDSDSGGSGDDG